MQRLAAPLGFLITLVVLVGVYAPTLVTPYGFLDAYTQLHALTQPSIEGAVPREMQLQWVMGRPVCGVLLELAFRGAGTISGLRLVRGATVLLLAVLCFTLSRILLRARWPRLDALAFPFLVVTLPSFQVYASWSSTAPYTIACLVALLAAWLGDRALRSDRTGRRTVLFLLAVLAQTVALTTYQPAGLFSLVVATAILYPPIPPDGEPSLSWRPVLAFGLVLVSGLALAFAVYRAGMLMFPLEVAGERAGLATDLAAKARWFASFPLRDALSFHEIHVSHRLAWASAALLVIGWSLAATGSMGHRALRLVLPLVLVPVSYLPNLLASESWSSYRTQPALASMVLLLFFVAVRTVVRRTPLARTWPVLVAIAMLAAGVTAFQNTRTLFAEPQAWELARLRERLASDPAIFEDEIRIRKAHWSDTPAPYARYDEFGVPTTSADWTVDPLVRLIAREMGVDGDSLRIRVLPAEEEVVAGDAHLVDMRALLTGHASARPRLNPTRPHR